jgi:hypothetical protein
MKGIAGALMLTLLLAGAVVLYLNGQSARSSLAAVDHTADTLRTGQVEAAPFDRHGAGRAIGVLEGALDDPASIPAMRSDLETIEADAAAWAEGAPTGSGELHTAVSIRAAAGQLLAYASDGRESHLARARSRLEEARRSLAGEPSARGPVVGLRDRLDSAQQSEQERLRQLDEALQ